MKKQGINGYLALNAKEAREIITSIIPTDATVGIGDSSAVRQIGIIESLKEAGQRVINPFDPNNVSTTVEENFQHTFWPMVEATVCDVFMTGSNALTEGGKIVNVDGVGNRVAGMVWGHPTTILVVGKNKIVQNLKEALARLKKVIAPQHVFFKEGQGNGPPCTVTRECLGCYGVQRVCAVTTIIEKKPLFTDIHVVIVDQDLGLGWDPSWAKERIDKIKEHHKKFMCPLPQGERSKETLDKLLKMAKQKLKGE